MLLANGSFADWDTGVSVNLEVFLDTQSTPFARFEYESTIAGSTFSESLSSSKRDAIGRLVGAESPSLLECDCEAVTATDY